MNDASCYGEASGMYQAMITSVQEMPTGGFEAYVRVQDARGAHRVTVALSSEAIRALAIGAVANKSGKSQEMSGGITATVTQRPPEIKPERMGDYVIAYTPRAGWHCQGTPLSTFRVQDSGQYRSLTVLLFEGKVLRYPKLLDLGIERGLFDRARLVAWIKQFGGEAQVSEDERQKLLQDARR